MNIKTRTCFENEFINIAKQKGYKARSGTIYKKKVTILYLCMQDAAKLNLHISQ